MNLSAFHSMGLWLAVTASPPAAPRSSTASCTVGVGAMPTSTTSQPTDCSAAAAARWNMGPLTRESRPRTTVRPGPRRRAYAPNAAAKVAITSGVSPSPTRPRTPETLTINRDVSITAVPLSGSGPQNPGDSRGPGRQCRTSAQARQAASRRASRRRAGRAFALAPSSADAAGAGCVRFPVVMTATARTMMAAAPSTRAVVPDGPSRSPRPRRTRRAPAASAFPS